MVGGEDAEAEEEAMVDEVIGSWDDLKDAPVD